VVRRALLLPLSRSSSLSRIRRVERLTRAALLVCLIFVGCKKREAAPTPAEVHAITRDLARAAAGAVPPGSDVRSRLDTDASHSARTDHLYVTIRAVASEQAARAALAKLIQSLDRVATARGLTHDPLAGSETVTRFEYRRSGLATQSIHIITAIPVGEAASAARSTGAAARLAIILDDMGSEREAADSVFALHRPLTISILPNMAHSSEIAEEAASHGYEVLLHLPMESVGEERAETAELRLGMALGNVATLVDEMLNSVPHAVGVNNHQGSRATADFALMSELMPILQQRRLFFIDSRTTTATVAYDAARRAGVRTAYRSTPFLDDVAETGAVREQLERAIRDARRTGSAIAIGHPHPATLEALREVLPQLDAQGVRLVFVSGLVQ